MPGCIVYTMGEPPWRKSFDANEPFVYKYYSPQWEEIEPPYMHIRYDQTPELWQDHTIETPIGLEKLLEAATVLGRELGTWYRIDFYMLDGEPIFGEFCWYPSAGLCYSEEGSKYLGKLWEEHLGFDTP